MPATISWTCDDGDWATPDCWDLGRVPEAGDDVVIDRPGEITVTHSTGTTQIQTLDSAEALTLSGGTLRLDGEATVFGPFLQSGGTWDGRGDLNIYGLFTWTGGQQAAPLSAFPYTRAFGGLELAGGSLRLDRRIENYGFGFTSAPTDILAPNPQGVMGRVINLPDASFVVQSGAPLQLRALSSFSGVFTNQGFLHLLDNMRLVSAGMSNAGYALLEGGSLTSAPGAISGGNGWFDLRGQSLDGLTGLGANGFVGGEGNLSISAEVATIAGTIDLVGDASLGPATGVIITGSVSVSGRLNIAARTEPRGATLFAGSVNLTETGRLLPSNGAALAALSGDIVSAGQVTLPEGTALFAVGAYRQTRGTTNMQGGSLVAEGGVFVEGGVLSGHGEIGGDLFNGATVLVGTSNTTGTLTVSGSYEQAANATLRMKLGGIDPGTFDQLLVGGTARLDGNLEVTLINGFEPTAGDTFALIQAGTRDGVFAALVLPSQLEAVYDDLGLALVAG